MLRRKNKRGDVTDALVVLIILFFLAVSFITVLIVNNKLAEIIDDNEQFNSTAAAPAISSAFNTINTVTVQRGFVIFFGLLVVGVIGSSFLVRVHPAFLFIYIIVGSFTIFVAVFLANIYDDMIDNPTIALVADGQPMINWIMAHLVKITLAISIISMIIVFSKIFGQPGGSLSNADI